MPHEKRLWSRSSGQIKQARGFRQFLLRGLAKVQGEWALVCLTHNIFEVPRILLCVTMIKLDADTQCATISSPANRALQTILLPRPACIADR